MHDRPIFDAILTPHRSMSLRGIRIVVAIYAILASLPAIYLFIEGAWPVVGFLGIDALALYWALGASRRSGSYYEEITLWPDTLHIRRVSQKGRENRIECNPFWVRLLTVRDNDDRVVAIKLRDQEGFFEIGKFLNPEDKESFALSFGAALQSARR